MKAFYLWQAALGYFSTTQINLNDRANPLSDEKSHRISFSKDWLGLGPWQLGTREAAWGSDPTEKYGGFRNLPYDASATYRSSIANNGTTAWTLLQATTESNNESYASAQLEVDFENVDWSFLQQVYGWAATQWQGWARGHIYIHLDSAPSANFVLHTEGILECWIDGQHYFGGDFYSFRRAPRLVHLENGMHVIDVRLTRDVRAMGGIGTPSLGIKITLEQAAGTLQNVSNVILSDIVAEEGRLGSPHASVYLLNEGDRTININSLRWQSKFCDFSSQISLQIVPGQTRPLVFQVNCDLKNTNDAVLEIFWDQGFDSSAASLVLDPKLRQRTLHEPQKVTFLHPSGVVSYTMMRPPSPEALRSCRHNNGLPILLAMHGAGLEADDELVKYSFDPLPDLCAWVIFPTGVTPWSGDDWHVWGFADVEAAVHAIETWIEQVGWLHIGVALDKWLVTGHSNGGQGAWYVLTHRPDNVLAAAPISGYSSIQNYVPYSFWQPVDPARTAMIHASLSTYGHETLLINAKGIPILQQHGGADDNVPAFHSRLLSQRLEQVGANSRYIEFPEKPHWWGGVMTTRQLAEFFQTELESFQDNPAPALHEWTLTTSNPASMGSKQGVEILRLMNPGQPGIVRVRLNRAGSSCIVRTSNIRTISLERERSRCRTMTIDHTDLGDISTRNVILTKFDASTPHWVASDGFGSSSSSQNQGQLGKQNVGMDGILRSRGAFHVIRHSKTQQAAEVALQVSRNLCQYFAADTELGSDYSAARQAEGNIISIAVGADLPPSSERFGAISVTDNEVCVTDQASRYCYGGEEGASAIFLRPLPNNRLELVIWAQQACNLDLAARLVPTLTGVGQPDFVILGDALIDGLGNALALGFYDESWGISRHAFFT